MSNNNNVKDFLGGLLAGAAIGSVFALLYAPEKGSDTRDKLSYRLKVTLDELNEVVEKLSKEKEELTNTAKDQSSKNVEEAKKRAQQLIKEAEDILKRSSEERAAG